MAKEQVQIETMEQVEEQQLEQMAADITEPAQVPEILQAEPEQEEQPVIYEQPTVYTKPKVAEKAKPVKKAVSSSKAIRYIGRNPSYTIGRHRFVKGGEAQKVEKELAEYALGLDCFEEA